MKKIEELFDDMMKAMYDGEVAQRQREDMRFSFFGGFMECFGFITKVLPELSEKEGEFELYLLRRELKQFWKNLNERQSTDSNDIPEHMD